jgi:hypothetical protein
VYVTSSALSEDVKATWAFAAPWNAKAATNASPAATDVDFDMLFPLPRASGLLTTKNWPRVFRYIEEDT